MKSLLLCGVALSRGTETRLRLYDKSGFDFR